MSIEHLNPESLPSSPAFSQGTIAPAGRTLYVGGQDGVGPDGELLDGDDAQVAQTISGEAGFAAALPIWGEHPTAITVVQVPAFARPDVLVEIDAIAALP
jgi:2-iminobutanoate/2-iminopropanoate deaminase